MTRKALKSFIIGLAVLFLGTFLITFLNLYEAFPHLDKLFHVVGGFIIAWFVSNFWEDNLKGFNQFQRVIIFMAMAGLAGLFWEIMEFSTSQPPLVYNQLVRHYLYGGSIIDTLGDLTADVLGGALLGLLKR